MLRFVKSEDVRGLVSQSGPLYVAGAISIVLTLTQQLVTARFLGAAEYGRLATAIGYATLALLFVDIRSWELGTRVIALPLGAHDHREVSRLFTWLAAGEVVVGLLGTCLVVGLTLVLRTAIGSDLSHALIVLSWLIPLRQLALGVSAALVRMLGAFRALAVRSVATACVRLLLIGGAAAAGLGLRGVAAAVVLAELFGATSAVALAAWVFRSRTGQRAVDWRRPTGLGAACRYAPKLWLSATIKGVQLETFIPVAAVFASSAEIGVLRTGMDVSQVANLATAPVAMVTAPQITALAQDDPHGRLRSRLVSTSRALIVISSMTAIIGAFGALVFLPRMLGDDFRSMGVVAVLLLIGSAFQATKHWVRPLLLGLDRVNEQSRLGIVLGLISLAALPPLAASFGAVGAAMDMSIFLIAYASLSTRIARKAANDVL